MIGIIISRSARLVDSSDLPSTSGVILRVVSSLSVLVPNSGSCLMPVITVTTEAWVVDSSDFAPTLSVLASTSVTVVTCSLSGTFVADSSVLTEGSPGSFLPSCSVTAFCSDVSGASVVCSSVLPSIPVLTVSSSASLVVDSETEPAFPSSIFICTAFSEISSADGV